MAMRATLIAPIRNPASALVCDRSSAIGCLLQMVTPPCDYSLFYPAESLPAKSSREVRVLSSKDGDWPVKTSTQWAAIQPGLTLVHTSAFPGFMGGGNLFPHKGIIARPACAGASHVIPGCHPEIFFISAIWRSGGQVFIRFCSVSREIFRLGDARLLPRMYLLTRDP